jgi:glycosyltransferase involved in cell wall biosynthesis
LHKRMADLGAITYANKIQGHRAVVLLRQSLFLIRFCKKHKIDVVYSHLQVANFIAVFSQGLIKANVFPCRHHIDEVAIVGNKRALKMEKYVSRKARKIIVVSNAAKRRMIDHEGVNGNKIVVIRLGYDFSLYGEPDPEKVSSIRKKTACGLLLVIMARMSENKRHIIGIEVMELLKKEGLDIKMLILGDGDERKNLEDAVKKKNLEDTVIFTGFVTNIIDYLSVADILVSPSIIESSNQVVKEAALLSKPSVVCSGIGDFDEYMIHRENGFLVPKDDAVTGIKNIITEFYSKKDQLKQVGERARKEVLERFDIKDVADKYLALPAQD